MCKYYWAFAKIKSREVPSRGLSATWGQEESKPASLVVTADVLANSFKGVLVPEKSMLLLYSLSIRFILQAGLCLDADCGFLNWLVVENSDELGNSQHRAKISESELLILTWFVSTNITFAL